MRAIDIHVHVPDPPGHPAALQDIERPGALVTLLTGTLGDRISVYGNVTREGREHVPGACHQSPGSQATDTGNRVTRTGSFIASIGAVVNAIRRQPSGFLRLGFLRLDRI
jgi:hypothetical protein